jgi:hypothetical protein
MRRQFLTQFKNVLDEKPRNYVHFSSACKGFLSQMQIGGNLTLEDVVMSIQMTSHLGTDRALERVTAGKSVTEFCYRMFESRNRFVTGVRTERNTFVTKVLDSDTTSYTNW